MGTDLFQIGNHKIRFKERPFNELTNEIKIILDSTVFPNADFLKLASLRWANSSPRNAREIREIKAKRHWTFKEESEYFNFAEDKQIHFYGPCGLHLTFNEHTITFWNPPYRYGNWFEMEDHVHRDEWRKYMYQVVKLFGGDRVLYAADNAHFLERYTEYEGTFEAMEHELRELYGNPKTTFKEVADNFDNSYFIDDFSSIDWNKSEPLEAYLPEPDDTSSTAYDLKIYSLKDNLKELEFNNEVIYHKHIGNKMHFYHLATVEGLLCVHTGIVGEHENLEVTLDAYAPFTYDTLVEKIEKQGYGYDCAKSFTIKFKGWNHILSWQNALADFEIELLWCGLGEKGGGYEQEDEKEERFYSVDEELAMKLLLDLGKQHHATGKIEMYRNHGTIDIFESSNETNGTLIYKQ